MNYFHKERKKFNQIQFLLVLLLKMLKKMEISFLKYEKKFNKNKTIIVPSKKNRFLIQ